MAMMVDQGDSGSQHVFAQAADSSTKRRTPNQTPSVADRLGKVNCKLSPMTRKS